MNTLDDREVAEQARASLRAVATVIDHAPPLRLPAGASQRARRRGFQRRWVRWGAPLAAAVTVTAVAVTLMAVREAPGRSRVTPANAASPTVPPPAGVPPRYYAAVDGRDLVIGDTFSGKAVARFTPPAHTNFQGVSAAADDRAFVAFTMPPSGSFKALAATWYEVRLTPGAATPATLTRLPIAPAANVVATALSASGREVAVGFADYVTGRRVVSVYSTATGRLLKSWRTADSSALEPNEMETAITKNVFMPTVVPALTWIDGDRAIAFATQTVKTGQGLAFTGTSLRRLNVAAGGGDLMAGSQVIWSAGQTGNSKANWGTDRYGCFLGSYPLISSGGGTVFCSVADMQRARATGQLVMKLLAYPATASAVARTRYQVTLPWTSVSPQTAATVTPLWTDSTGSTALITWWVQDVNGKILRLHFGYVTGGRFTPVPVPVSTRLPYPPIIAW